MKFRPDRDLETLDGRTVLSSRARQRVARARTTLLTTLGLLSLGLVTLLFLRLDLDRIAGAEAVSLLQIRLDADRDARIQVAQAREAVLVAILRDVLTDKTDPDADQAVRVGNLKLLFADQRKVRKVAEENRQILGDFHALTVIQVGKKLLPVNATANGAYRPEIVAAYLRDTPAISGVLHAAVTEALAKAPRDPRAIVRADLAKVLAARRARLDGQPLLSPFSPSLAGFSHEKAPR